MVGPLSRIRDTVLGKCLKRGSKKVSNRAGGCGGCGGCTFLGRLLRDLVQIKLQPPQPPQPPARFDTFLESLFKQFLRTVCENEGKGPTKTAYKMERMTNTLALSDPPGTTQAEAHGGEDLPPPPAKGVWGEGNLPEAAKWQQKCSQNVPAHCLPLPAPCSCFSPKSRKWQHCSKNVPAHCLPLPAPCSCF